MRFFICLLIVCLTTASELTCSTSYKNWYKNTGNHALTANLVDMYAPQFFQRMRENNYEVDYGSLVYKPVFGATQPGKGSRAVKGYKAAVNARENEDAEYIRYEIHGESIVVDNKLTFEDIFDVC
tara:strand:+ start:3436 stop:3810 length:375 start_codon:yes stop_codon:yes gene_type:complete